jgi:hypothetical protein
LQRRANHPLQGIEPRELSGELRLPRNPHLLRKRVNGVELSVEIGIQHAILCGV